MRRTEEEVVAREAGHVPDPVPGAGPDPVGGTGRGADPSPAAGASLGTDPVPSPAPDLATALAVTRRRMGEASPGADQDPAAEAAIKDGNQLSKYSTANDLYPAADIIHHISSHHFQLRISYLRKAQRQSLAPLTSSSSTLEPKLKCIFSLRNSSHGTRCWI